MIHSVAPSSYLSFFNHSHFHQALASLWSFLLIAILHPSTTFPATLSHRSQSPVHLFFIPQPTFCCHVVPSPLLLITWLPAISVQTFCTCTCKPVYSPLIPSEVPLTEPVLVVTEGPLPCCLTQPMTIYQKWTQKIQRFPRNVMRSPICHTVSLDLLPKHHQYGKGHISRPGTSTCIL